MREFIAQSAYFGVSVSLLGYGLGLILQKKYKKALFNPLLIGIVFTTVVVLLLDLDYETYNESAKYLSYLLTPATVALAIPLYQKLQILRENALAVIVGITSGVLASLGSILLIALLFGLSHEEYITLLPKSVTTAIAIGVVDEFGGVTTITVILVALTGVVGNVMAEGICRLFRITEPIAKGLAIGTAAHAGGTAKALEMGETEGAMGSLAIVVAGLITVVAVSVFAMFL